LSGGGIRAAVFHLGVLHRLADEGLLESVSRLSTVSGGSLVAAALVSRAGMRWPTSAEYKLAIYPALRALFTTVDLLSLGAVGIRGLVRFNAALLRRRAGVLAVLLRERWGVNGRLANLPDAPLWWINTTCIETGKNWRFAKREMGDWQFGRHYEPPLLLAEAAAASAAVPYAIGASRVTLPEQGWYVTDPATGMATKRCKPAARHVHLWDGGAYDNLGLEPLYKPGEALVGCDFLLVSDASGPLGPPVSPPRAMRRLFRGHLASPRLFDVVSDQIRALRSRMLVRDLQRGTFEGVLVRMGNSVRDIDLKSGQSRDHTEYDQFQGDREAALALLHPTDLRAVSEALFDRIARHGHEVTDATLAARASSRFPHPYAWRCS
jgi:NTE family protein